MSTRISIWLQAFRLRTLPLALSSTFLGSFMAYSHDRFNWGVFVFAVTTTLFLQILSNLANDYGDARKGTDNENRIGPQRVAQAGLVSMQAIKRMIITFVILALISGSLLIYYGLSQFPFYLSAIFFIVGLTAIYAAIKYTVGRNPYGYVGFGDVFVYLYFGLVGVGGTYFLHAGTINPWILLPASTIGLFSSAVLNLNNMRDIENDAKCGKRTLVVRIGIKSAKIYHLALLVLATASSIIYTILFYDSPVQLLFMVTIPFLYSDIKKVWTNTIPGDLNPELKKLALTTFAFAMTFGAGLIMA